MSRLDTVDLTVKLPAGAYEERLARAQARLLQLRLLYAGLTFDERRGPPVLLLFEGWDASGKGGAIRRLLQPLDPRHLRIAAFGAPDEVEKRRHFLYRFWRWMPGWGEFTVLDRSWYGRVLVERVEGYATPEEWGRAYDEIVAFEQLLVAEGAIVVKFWMHVSPEEQLKRFEARERDPQKAWKLTPDDWRNREKRPAYEEAVEAMLSRTDQAGAPWVVVAGDSKKYARVKVIETVVEAMERGLREHDRVVPAPPASAG